MKRLLLPLLAALALPTAVNAGYKADIDLMNDKNEIMVWIQSENFVKNVLKQEAPVGIVIQCGSELTIAGLQTGNVMEGSSTSVRIRWDSILNEC